MNNNQGNKIPDQSEVRLKDLAGRKKPTNRKYSRRRTTTLPVNGGVVALFIILFVVGGGLYGYKLYRDSEKAEQQQKEADAKREKDAAVLAKVQAEEEARKAEQEQKLKELEELQKQQMARLLEAQKMAEAQSQQMEQQFGMMVQMLRAQQEKAGKAADAMQEAAVVLDKADKLIEKWEFAKAATMLQEMDQNPYLAGEKKACCTRMYQNAQLITSTLKEIKPGPRASAIDMYRITLRNDTVFVGKITSDALGKVTVLNDTGAQVTYPSERIYKREPITQKELDKANIKELARISHNAETAPQIFALSQRSLELGQRDIAIKCFLKALKEDPTLAQNVREARARKLYASAAFQRSLGYNRVADTKFAELQKKYPETKAAGLARGHTATEKQFVAEMADKPMNNGEGTTADISSIRHEVELARSNLSLEEKNLSRAQSLLSNGTKKLSKAQSGELNGQEMNKELQAAAEDLKKIHRHLQRTAAGRAAGRGRKENG